jgi:hypothetical protein
VRRIDHAAIAPLELVDVGHLGLAQGEIENREIGGEMAGIFAPLASTTFITQTPSHIRIIQ